MGERLVSVVIPAYNAARFLPEAVESVLSQTYGNIEVLVVDDGSTDETGSVVEPFSADKRFRYHFKENGGPSSARNAGVHLAKGSHIAFMDGDDVWYPHKLETQMPLFDQHPSPGVVFSDRHLIDERGRPMSGCPWTPYRGPKLYERLLVENFVPTSSAVVAAEVFQSVGFFDESQLLSEDCDFWLRASVCYTFDFVSEPLEAHRKWSMQATANKVAMAEAGLAVRRRFLERNPGLVSRRQTARAWSTMYARRGRSLGEIGRRGGALRDLAHALWHQPTNWEASKLVAKLFLCRL